MTASVLLRLREAAGGIKKHQDLLLPFFFSFRFIVDSVGRQMALTFRTEGESAGQGPEIRVLLLVLFIPSYSEKRNLCQKSSVLSVFTNCCLCVVRGKIKIITLYLLNVYEV